MPTINPERLFSLLKPYLDDFSAPPSLYDQLAIYLDLLLKWNARTNLTAIRDLDEIVRRHFGESLFAGRHLAAHLPTNATLLDFGSGAGFPGLPIQLLLPSLRVTLAESQNKKATFLREAVRTLGLPTQVFAARVETMPATSLFDAVTLRAVDNMAAAMEAAEPRVAAGGWLILLTSAAATDVTTDVEAFPLPNTATGLLTMQKR
jgi:16S rRNA (guanine527-N7)-methyltransferase